jgi:hypothetical protein
MAMITLTPAEQAALQCAIEMRLENIIEVREQTGDDEHDQSDEDQCGNLVAVLSDYDVDTDDLLDLDHLTLAVENLLDWPAEDLELIDIDGAALRSGMAKLGGAS